MAKFNIFTRFESDDVVPAGKRLVTEGVFTDGDGSIGTTDYSGFFTSSEQIKGHLVDGTISSSWYYIKLYDRPPTESQWQNLDRVADISYGSNCGWQVCSDEDDENYDEEAYGVEYNPARAVYKQYARTLLPDSSNGKFNFNGSDTDEIFVINLRRECMKEKIDKGNWELELGNNCIQSRATIMGVITNTGDTSDDYFYIISGNVSWSFYPSGTETGNDATRKYSFLTGSGGSDYTKSRQVESLMNKINDVFIASHSADLSFPVFGQNIVPIWKDLDLDSTYPGWVFALTVADGGSWGNDLSISSSMDNYGTVTTSSDFSGGGSGEMTLIDDSRNSPTAFPPVNMGTSYYVVSGSKLIDGYNVDSSGTKYGAVYPNYGLIVLDAEALNYYGNIRLNFSSSKVYNYNIGVRACSDYSMSYAYDVTREFIYSMELGSNFKVRNAEEINSIHYFCRLKNKRYNFSNNPTWVTGSQNRLRYKEMFYDPKVFITTVGLYNEQDELLAIAKLNKPLEKSYQKELLVKVRLDY